MARLVAQEMGGDGGERDEAGGGEGFGDVDDVLGGEAAAAGEEGKERGK